MEILTSREGEIQGQTHSQNTQLQIVVKHSVLCCNLKKELGELATEIPPLAKLLRFL